MRETVDSAFFPHPAGVVLNARVAGWLAAANAVTLRALRPPQPADEAQSPAALARLATDAAALDALSAHIRYDSVPVRPAPRIVRLMLRQIRLMFSAQDWHDGLRQSGQRLNGHDTDPVTRAFAALAAIAAGRWRPDPATYARRALERYTVLAPYLDRPDGSRDMTTPALLGELRIGLNLLRLQQERAVIPDAARPAVTALLAAVAGHFDARSRGAAAPVDALAKRNAAAMIAAEQAMPAPGAQTAWLMLAGVQRSLFGTTAWAGIKGGTRAG